MSQTLIIVDGRDLFAQMRHGIYDMVRVWNLPGEHAFENLYDWLVIEGFRRAIRIQVPYHVDVTQVPYNDVYKCIFDHVGEMVTRMVLELIEANRLTFLRGSRIKMIVTFEDIVLVRNYS